jgi:glucuronate isomerase
MSKSFIHYNWLLSTTTAQNLYHNYAAPQPIIDYHNHLSPEQVATNHRFANLHEAWLAGDHYKWRAMRVAGIEERFITGSASPLEKFQAFAKTVPLTARNPLFHWSHLELQRYFGISDLLTEANANAVFEQASEQLQAEGNGARELLEKQKVKLICTTDDPVDSLEHHYAHKQSGNALSMRPTFRPDKSLQAHKLGWRTYLETLGEIAGVDVTDYASLLKALELRMDHFAKLDCCISDHGLEYVPAARYDQEAADTLLRSGEAPKDRKAAEGFMFTLLVDLGRSYAKRGWTMQLHLGPIRNNNTRAERELGPDTGYDSIGDFPQARGLSYLLDTLNNTDELPKTILYNLNPADNHVFATMAGNFCGGGSVAKVQWGAAWWFLDQWDGMKEQINTLSSVGLLSQFVGMLTDSRSFLSFPRHEYFRRLLCEMLGDDVAAGRLPNDEAWLGKQVEDICYGNAERWFGF